MSRKVLIPLLVAVLGASLIVGVLVARAQGNTTLPAVSPPELLANVATEAHDTTSISGEVAWKNALVGDMSALNLGGATTPTGIGSLLQGGEGRIWLQDGKVRLESRGQGGDLVVTAADGSVWVYSSTSNTATEYAPRAGAGGAGSATPSPSASSFDPAAQIERALQELAPTAELAVTGQESVAGRESYILALTPTASNTTFGSLRVAIDGTTFVPLRIEVFAEGAPAPALSAGFTSVSYASIDDEIFRFTPPAGAEVVHETLDLPEGFEAGEGVRESPEGEPGDGKTDDESGSEPDALTLDEAQARAGFDLALPSGPALPFNGARVIPAPSAEDGSDPGGPIAVLHYGKGFASIVLIETEATADQADKLQEELTQLAEMRLVRPTSIDGSPGVAFSTSLFNVVAWQRGELMLAAAGMVPQSELSAFAGSVQ